MDSAHVVPDAKAGSEIQADEGKAVHEAALVPRKLMAAMVSSFLFCAMIVGVVVLCLSLMSGLRERQGTQENGEDGLAFKVGFKDNETGMTTTLLMDTQRHGIRIDIPVSGTETMTVLNSGGSQWDAYIMLNETVGNKTFAFVTQCFNFTVDDEAPAVDLSFLFPDKHDDATNMSMDFSGMTVNVRSPNGVVIKVPLEDAVLGTVTGDDADEQNDRSSVVPRSLSLVALSSSVYVPPAACRGHLSDNAAVAREYTQMRREENKRWAQEVVMEANTSLRGANRRLADLDGTAYCGPNKEGPGVPRSAVDRCCAFHDNACASNYFHETGSNNGGWDSSLKAPRTQFGIPTWGFYEGRPEHCGCAVALFQCAAAAANFCGGSSLDLLNAQAVMKTFGVMPCWKQETVKIPYPCGMKMCRSGWFEYPCVKWCHKSETKKVFHPLTQNVILSPPNRACNNRASSVGSSSQCEKTAFPCDGVCRCRSDHHCVSWGWHTPWCYVDQGTCEQGHTHAGYWSELPCKR